MPIDKSLAILRELCRAIEDTVSEFPNGAPAGPMYMALAQADMTLEQFEGIMSALVTAGKLEKRGHCYFSPRHADGSLKDLGYRVE